MNKLAKLVIFGIGLLCILPTLFPYFGQGFFHLHDFTHVARLSELDRALVDGHFPPRWSKNLGYGYGMPQFIFYGPLAYYVAEVFHWSGFDYLTSIKMLVVATSVAGYTALFIAGRSLTRSSWGGLVSGMVFTYAPYRAVDAYVRGALGELLALTVIGFVLHAIILMGKRINTKHLVYLAITLALLPLAHNLSALISYPFLFILIFAFIAQHKLAWWKKIGSTLIVFFLALGLSAYYTIPALAEKGFTRVDELTQGFSNYKFHFLYWRQFFDSYFGYGGSVLGPKDDMSFYLGLIILTMAGLGFTSGILNRQMRRRWGLSLVAVVLVIFVALWLTTFRSQWLWDAIPLLSYIQFPWRFLVIVVPLLALLASALVRMSEGLGLWRTGLAITVSLGALMILYTPYFKPEKYLSDVDLLYYSEENRIQTHMSEIIPDFMPKFAQTSPQIPPTTRFEWQGSGLPIAAELDRTHEFLLVLNHPTEELVRVNIAYYPGWTLYVDGVESAGKIDERTGGMLVGVPVGKERVILSGVFKETPLRLAANLVTVLSIAMVIYLVGKKRLYE